MTSSEPTENSGDDPVEVQEALDVSDDGVEPPTDPSEQPSLPDFNT